MKNIDFHYLGFEEMRFINYPGRSFKARLHQIQQTHPDVHYFLPAVHNGPVYDHNLNQVGQVSKLGNREMDVDSNSSMVCTKCRYICECGFARVAEQKISGTRVPLNFHFKESAGCPLVFRCDSISRTGSVTYSLSHSLSHSVANTDFCFYLKSTDSRQ